MAGEAAEGDQVGAGRGCPPSSNRRTMGLSLVAAVAVAAERGLDCCPAAGPAPPL